MSQIKKCRQKGTQDGSRRFAFEVMFTVQTIHAVKESLYVVGGKKRVISMF